MTDLRLVLLDIDGCLSAGEAQPLNLQAFQFIADLNQRARLGDAPFAVTICTGRPAPYTEAMMQAIGAHTPAVYENGGGLYLPAQMRTLLNPRITTEMRAELAEIHHAIQRELVERELAYIQPGKDVSLTLYPMHANAAFEELAAQTRLAIRDIAHHYHVQASRTCVEVLPPGIDKGIGVDWLSRETGIALHEMGGVGDAPLDLTFLQRMGRSATVANGADSVKAAVQYVATQPDILGVVEILQHWLAQE